jgi:hypothetical protein
MSLRHERRRRLTTDEPLSDNDDERISDRAEGDQDRSESNSPSYPEATSRRHRQQVQDLLPARYLTIGLLATFGLGIVALLEIGHAWAGSLAAVLSPEDVTSLDLRWHSSLSGWFAAMLATGAGVLAAFIYSLRRHRLDDYHGRYRVWIWTAVACLLAGAAETTDIGGIGRGLCRHVAQLCGLDNAVVWPLVVTVVLVAVLLRLKIEVRRCRAAIWALGATTTAFLTAAACYYGWFIEPPETVQPMVLRGAWLTGYILMLAAFLLYARHVVREIDGLIVVRPAKAKRRKSKFRRTDPPEETPPAPHRHTSRTDLDDVEKSHGGYSTSRGRSEDSDESDGGNRGLSRAERRRLKREARYSR